TAQSMYLLFRPSTAHLALSSISFQGYRHHRHLHSFPTRRSSDLYCARARGALHLSSMSSISRTGSRAGCTIPTASCGFARKVQRSEEHTSELQSRFDLVCRLLLEKKKHKARNPQERQLAQQRALH